MSISDSLWCLKANHCIKIHVFYCNPCWHSPTTSFGSSEPHSFTNINHVELKIMLDFFPTCSSVFLTNKLSYIISYAHNMIEYSNLRSSWMSEGSSVHWINVSHDSILKSELLEFSSPTSTCVWRLIIPSEWVWSAIRHTMFHSEKRWCVWKQLFCDDHTL